jgi:hypothetical protein
MEVKIDLLGWHMDSKHDDTLLASGDVLATQSAYPVGVR